MNKVLLHSIALITIFSLSAISSPGGTITVTSTKDAGSGSLRQALFQANATSGTDTVRFAIVTKKAISATISPISPLPPVTDPIVIDATGSRPMQIVLDGQMAGISADGLTILAGSSVVRGLTLVNFDGCGIRIGKNGGNRIEECHIGIDASGKTAEGNGVGIYIDRSPRNTVGGTSPGQRNIISGNRKRGIEIFGRASSGNVVSSNYVGLNATGTVGVGNGTGIMISDAPSNSIGGSSAGGGNVVSGNRGPGIVITADGSSFGDAVDNTVQGNIIGLNAGATNSVANGTGVQISGAASRNTIGGYLANIIAGNTGAGVDINGTLSFASASENRVRGNVVGLDGSGTRAVGNGRGIVVRGSAPKTLIGDGNTISGNVFDGLEVIGRSARNTTIFANNIGTSVNGLMGIGNGTAGIRLEDAEYCTVGAAGAGNIIAANAEGGIVLIGISARVRRCTIIGNLVGAGRDANVAFGNVGSGIECVNADSCIIGGFARDEGNVICSGFAGIELDSSNFNNVVGNLIGVASDGHTAHGNTFAGIVVRSSEGNTVGGRNAGAANTISGNGVGIRLTDGATRTEIIGNTIGLDSSRQLAIGNVNDGIFLDNSGDNLIGDTTARGGNIIVANGGNGIFLLDTRATNNRIVGNSIGVDGTGTRPLPNVGSGILVRNASGNLIGGDQPGEGNRVACNRGTGVLLDSSSRRITIRGNEITGNNLLGIDLSGDNVTLNDPTDVDSGANDCLNYPMISAATSGEDLIVSGTFDGHPNESYIIDVYGNAVADSSGFGEGQYYLGWSAITTNARGEARFDIRIATPLPIAFVSATATDSAGNTSEFSATSMIAKASTVNDAVESIRDRLSVAPNPVVDHARIHLNIGGSTNTEVRIYSMSGELLRRLDASMHANGSRVLQWDARDDAGRRLPTGVYVLEASAGSAVYSLLVRVAGR